MCFVEGEQESNHRKTTKRILMAARQANTCSTKRSSIATIRNPGAHVSTLCNHRRVSVQRMLEFTNNHNRNPTIWRHQIHQIHQIHLLLLLRYHLLTYFISVTAFAHTQDAWSQP